MLADGTDEEYRRLLELYINIDDHLTEKLVKRALQHEDEDIREAGEDFQNYLKNVIRIPQELVELTSRVWVK